MIEFNLAHLDSVTRAYMLAELDSDLKTDTLAFSRDFSEHGRNAYSLVLREALTDGHVHTLEAALNPTFFNPERTDKNGKVTRLNLADSAAKFAGGEFNRFYLRGLCLRAIAECVAELVVYRAKAPANPRPESEAMIGKRLLATDLLADLRANKGFGTYLGVPMGPHSGLSARFP